MNIPIASEENKAGPVQPKGPEGIPRAPESTPLTSRELLRAPRYHPVSARERLRASREHAVSKENKAGARLQQLWSTLWLEVSGPNRQHTVPTNRGRRSMAQNVVHVYTQRTAMQRSQSEALDMRRFHAGRAFAAHRESRPPQFTGSSSGALARWRLLVKLLISHQDTTFWRDNFAALRRDTKETIRYCHRLRLAQDTLIIDNF